MSRLATLALILGLGVPSGGQAAVLDDFLAQGYTVVAATRVPGSFTGCVRQHRLAFADGSVLACARTVAQTAYEPRVTILRLGAGPPSVVLAGSSVLAGQLLRLGLHDYPVPLRMNPDPLGDRPATPSTALQPLQPIPSINDLTKQQNASVSQQQDQLPQRPRNFRSSR